MKFIPPPKRKKLDPAPSSSSSHCTPGVPSSGNRDMGMRTSMQCEPEDSTSQESGSGRGTARQDGCTGNFKLFDSPFGNYLVPVIPTRAELGG